MESTSDSSMKISPLDLMAAIFKGKMDPSNSSAGAEVTSVILENREFVMILTTSIAVLIGCVVVFFWRRSHGQKAKVVQPLKPLVIPEPEPEPDDGSKKVTIFYGTQTGTAEGFAKVLILDLHQCLNFNTFSFLSSFYVLCFTLVFASTCRLWPKKRKFATIRSHSKLLIWYGWFFFFHFCLCCWLGKYWNWILTFLFYFFEIMRLDVVCLFGRTIMQPMTRHMRRNWRMRVWQFSSWPREFQTR